MKCCFNFLNFKMEWQLSKLFLSLKILSMRKDFKNRFGWQFLNCFLNAMKLNAMRKNKIKWILFRIFKLKNILISKKIRRLRKHLRSWSKYSWSNTNKSVHTSNKKHWKKWLNTNLWLNLLFNNSSIMKI